MLFKGPKCRELQSIFLKHDFKILKDSVEDYPRTWTKHKRREDTLFSKWGMAVMSLIRIKIKK